ncbi:unnamed protein product, partial [Candidula unifasciata]
AFILTYLFILFVLKPIRIVILGPPASGKSTVAKQLCDFYKLHHIQIKEVIDEAIASLKAKTKRLSDLLPEEMDDYEPPSDLTSVTRDLLDEIELNRESNNGRIEDKYIISFLRDKLMSMPCQNQGFVLDGYPKTIAQARELYKSLTPDEPSVDLLDAYNRIILPEFVVNLEATDAFLMRKVMNLPEAVVMNTHNTEAGLTRRLKEYWAVNTYDETVLNFFDELELQSEKIDVTKDSSPMMKDTVEKIKKSIGSPRNYGTTVEELEQMKKLEEQGRMKKERRERRHMERHEAEEQQEKKRRLEEWSQRLQEVKKQEFELLEVQSIPLRNYLMVYVMPTLTQGLIECCKVRPDDPIDFLAEFLFQHNPQMD